MTTSKFLGTTKTGQYLGYDHATFYVGSVKSSAHYLMNVFGFRPYYSMNLETGSRNIVSKVVRNGNVIIELLSTVKPLHSTPEDPSVDEIHTHIAVHGDSVKDVAFKVDNVEAAYERALNGGGKAIMDPRTFTDENGQITIAKVGALADTIHTLIDRSKYRGYLPGPYQKDESSHDIQPQYVVELSQIDHIVQNDDWNMMNIDCDYYTNVFGFHQFWSVDDTMIHTAYSALKSTVMASENEIIKMPVNEPAKGLKTSQIEEFMDYNVTAGIQHLALRVDNIITAIDHMRKRGVEFIAVPDVYYSNLAARLKGSKHPEFEEDMKKIQDLGILVDFDEQGYLLQLFTRPLFDRPTFFFEIIQRHNHNGFGAGNFKSLFEVLEDDQARRGNLRDN